MTRLIVSCCAAVVLTAATPSWAQTDFSARSSVQSISPENRQRVTALYEKGNRLLNAKRYAEAERAFMDALELAPDIPAIHHSLGLIYVQTQEYESAVLHLEEALRREPGQSKTLYTLAKAYAAIGENDKAEERYLEAIRIKPSFEAAHQELAGIYYRKKNWDAAFASLEKARAVNPDSMRTLKLIGVTAVYAGRTDLALDAVTEMRRLGRQDQARRLEYLIYTEKAKNRTEAS